MLWHISFKVWARRCPRVSEHLKPNGEGVLTCYLREKNCEVAEIRAGQAHFHKLELVCSHFREVFAVHSELSTDISINTAAHTLLPALLLWVHRWRNSDATFRSFSEETAPRNVRALACPCSLLHSIFLIRASASAVHVLPVFRS